MPQTLHAEQSSPLTATAHTHDWRLRSVEFEDGVEISQFDCGGCPEVTFR